VLGEGFGGRRSPCRRPVGHRVVAFITGAVVLMTTVALVLVTRGQLSPTPPR